MEFEWSLNNADDDIGYFIDGINYKLDSLNRLLYWYSTAQNKKRYERTMKIEIATINILIRAINNFNKVNELKLNENLINLIENDDRMKPINDKTFEGDVIYVAPVSDETFKRDTICVAKCDLRRKN